jgi:hypothetical protein
MTRRRRSIWQNARTPLALAILVTLAVGSSAEDAIDFRPAAGFLQLPPSMTLGPCSGVDIDRRGNVFLPMGSAQITFGGVVVHRQPARFTRGRNHIDSATDGSSLRQSLPPMPVIDGPAVLTRFASPMVGTSDIAISSRRFGPQRGPAFSTEISYKYLPF